MSDAVNKASKIASRHVACVRTLLVFALFAFLFHFAWEILQAPLFARMPKTSHWQATLACLKATFGDIGIALASFAVAALWSRSCAWFLHPSIQGLAAYTAAGVLITIAFEWYAISTGRWAYSELMPVVPGLRMGLSPLLQWLALPLVALYFLRRHELGGNGWRAA
jgi:hypothetical protein